MKSKKVIDNNKEIKKEKKTYSLGALFLVIIIFVIFSIGLTFIRNMKSTVMLPMIQRLYPASKAS